MEGVEQVCVHRLSLASVYPTGFRRDPVRSLPREWRPGTRDQGPDWDSESGPELHSGSTRYPAPGTLVVVHRRFDFRQTGVHHGGVHGELGVEGRRPAGLGRMPEQTTEEVHECESRCWSCPC
jgi:hypothetical protein